MARITERNEIVQFIGRSVCNDFEKSKRRDVMHVQGSTQHRFGESAQLTSVPVASSCLSALPKPIRSVVVCFSSSPRRIRSTIPVIRFPLTEAGAIAKRLRILPRKPRCAFQSSAAIDASFNYRSEFARRLSPYKCFGHASAGAIVFPAECGWRPIKACSAMSTGDVMSFSFDDVNISQHDVISMCIGSEY